MAALSRGLFLLAFLIPRFAAAAETEYDSCTCKVVQVGASSTLRGGVCQRTEAGSCLMEWGATSKGRAPVGNKKSKEETAADAAKILDGVLGPNFKFNPSVQSDTPTLQMTSAVITLARTPPSEYEKSAVIAESFVFVAAAALSRFEVPLAALAKTLLRDHRKELVEGLQKERTLEIDRFLIKARTGCLEVDLQSSTIRVYVKTPFAPSDKC